MKKRTSRQRRPRRILWILIFFFCAGMAGGFLGGVYFSQHAPAHSTHLADTLQDAALRLGEQARRLWRNVSSEDVPDHRPTDVSQGNGSPIDIFFAPARAHHGRQIDEALIALIQNAEQSVLCAFYDFELENVAQALIERHNAGVAVGIVSDSDYARQPGITLCIQAGIPVVFDERSALMHNKFCVVDAQYVWTGSTNITHNCMYRNNNNALLIASPQLAVNFTNEFEEMFLHGQFGASSPRNTAFPTVTLAHVSVETYFAPEDGVEQAIIAHLAESREEITFMTFVFTSKPIAKKMASRLAAGVHVRGIIERRSAGSRYSRHAYLRERGATIVVDNNPQTMHHKVIVVDARLVMTGSYNLSANAENRNDENMLIVHCRDTAGLFLQEFERISQ